MIVKDAQFVYLGRAFYFGLSRGDIFPILSAAGIRTIRRSHESQRPLYTVFVHLMQRIRYKWVPVAIAPIYRQTHRVFIQLRAQGFD
jgi:hypothetical protein